MRNNFQRSGKAGIEDKIDWIANLIDADKKSGNHYLETIKKKGDAEPLYFEKGFSRKAKLFSSYETGIPLHLLVYKNVLIGYDKEFHDYDSPFNNDRFVFMAGDLKKLCVKKEYIKIIFKHYEKGQFSSAEYGKRFKDDNSDDINHWSDKDVFSIAYAGCAKDFLDNSASEGKRKHKEMFERYYGEEK